MNLLGFVDLLRCLVFCTVSSVIVSTKSYQDAASIFIMIIVMVYWFVPVLFGRKRVLKFSVTVRFYERILCVFYVYRT